MFCSVFRMLPLCSSVLAVKICFYWLRAFTVSQTDDKISLHNLSWQIHNQSSWYFLLFCCMPYQKADAGITLSSFLNITCIEEIYQIFSVIYFALNIVQWSWIWCNQEKKKKTRERKEGVWGNQKDTLRNLVVCFVLPGRISRVLLVPESTTTFDVLTQIWVITLQCRYAFWFYLCLKNCA